MEKSHSESYRKAGVDISAGYRAVELMKGHVARTAIPGLLSGLGGFGGMFELDTAEMPHPVLVSGTDGVGTKLRLAFMMDRHDTVGIDCVAMCVNDVVCTGARPLFLLDYIACGKNVPERIAALVSGVAEGCVQAGCALAGGETAEMPGFYAENEYDLAGFCVGAVDRDNLVDSSRMQPGDAVIGLASSGAHSNGFSLIRSALNLDRNPAILEEHDAELGRTLGEALLEPTRIYVSSVLALREALPVSGVAHITGGGFFENMPRCLPQGLSIRLEQLAVPVPRLFEIIMRRGDIPLRDMYNTFNMGVGMIVVVPREEAARSLALLAAQGERAAVIGEIVAGDGGVLLDV